MPDLDFQVTGVEAAVRGLTPLLHFKVSIHNNPETETIHTVMLHAQIQIRSPQRGYNGVEKEKLVELFGKPERWGQTLRNRLWGLSDTTVRTFTGSTEAILPLPCTFDLNIAATKYFYALEGGDVPLLFLFSGSVFYEGKDGRLQVQQISWNKECSYGMPLEVWQKMMDQHYPNSAWLSLQRDAFDRLYAFKRSQGFATWEETVASLLDAEEKTEVAL
jgi:hypothetical protein